MAIQIVDGFGEWDDLGTVEPVFEDWLTFPDFTNSSSTLLRLTYLFEEFDQNSYGFIRCKYEAENTFAIGRWLRFYPKFEDEFIRYPHSEDLLALKGDFKRIYQVMKRHRRRRFNGTFAATLWSVNLNVCTDQVDEIPNNSNQLENFSPGVTFNWL